MIIFKNSMLINTITLDKYVNFIIGFWWPLLFKRMIASTRSTLEKKKITIVLFIFLFQYISVTDSYIYSQYFINLNWTSKDKSSTIGKVILNTINAERKVYKNT